jgi:hypothetical protein
MSGWNDYQKKLVQRVVDDFQYQIDHESIEDYRSARPYPLVPRRDTNKYWQDCTSNIKLVVCSWNPIPTFDGTPKGYGDTRSFWQGPRVYHVGGGPAQWQLLDILLYKQHDGPFRGGSDEHATVIIGKRNGVWKVCSHGGNSGPQLRDFNYRSDLAAVIRFPIPLKAG